MARTSSQLFGTLRKLRDGAGETSRRPALRSLALRKYVVFLLSVTHVSHEQKRER